MTDIYIYILGTSYDSKRIFLNPYKGKSFDLKNPDSKKKNFLKLDFLFFILGTFCVVENKHTSSYVFYDRRVSGVV